MQVREDTSSLTFQYSVIMGKMIVSRELEKFHALFSNISYGLDDSTVFDDFLSFIIHSFGIDCPWEPHNQYKNGPQILLDLLQEFLEGLRKSLLHSEWFDGLGTYYEEAVSSYRRRANSGQFFTPPTIVDLMTLITVPSLDKRVGEGIAVLDSSCGSGRTLLSFHVKAPGNYLYGEDIDRTCAMMATCNLLFHGGVGQIVWHDSLNPDSYFGGWSINQNLYRTGIPGVEKLKKEDSYVYQYWKRKQEEETIGKQPELFERQLRLF